MFMHWLIAHTCTIAALAGGPSRGHPCVPLIDGFPGDDRQEAKDARYPVDASRGKAWLEPNLR